MKTINKMINLRLLALLFAGLLVTSCSDDDDAVPEEENELEVITNVTLIFTPTDGGDVVMATAVDADGAGIGELEVLNAIELSVDTEYTLTYDILNALDPTDVEDIGDEVREEDNEHQLYYAFTNDVFADPMGDGNIDNASDPVNYTDEDLDENGNNVGLITTWTTSATPSSEGSFTTRLQHQPDLKSATTGATDGDTDFDLTFVLNVN